MRLEKQNAFLKPVWTSDPLQNPNIRFTWASNWFEWNKATRWPQRYGPVHLPEEVKDEFDLVEESRENPDDSIGSEEGTNQAAITMGRYLKAMCWDDPVEYLRKIAACGYHLGRVSASNTDDEKSAARFEKHKERIMSELPYLLAQSKHAEFCRRLINAGCLAPSDEELDDLEKMPKSQLYADPPTLPALYIKPFCLLSRRTKELYIALAKAQLQNLLDLLYFGKVDPANALGLGQSAKLKQLQPAEFEDGPHGKEKAPFFTLKLRFLSRLKV
eukprot:tig00000404_g422.t1